MKLAIIHRQLSTGVTYLPPPSLRAREECELSLTPDRRATLVQGVNPYRQILSTLYTPSQTEYSFPLDRYHTAHVVVRATFDHDRESHLLVQQCTTGPTADFLHEDRWEFALYHVSGTATHLHTFFDAPTAPYAEASQMIECWTAHGHYGGLTNAVEALPDSSDTPPLP